MIESYREIQRGPEGQLLTVLSLVLVNLKNSRSSILPELASMFDMADVAKMSHIFGGCTITIPTVDELNGALIEVLCLYYRKIKGLEWVEIHRRIPYEFDAQAMSRKINNVYDQLTPEVMRMFDQIDIPEAR